MIIRGELMIDILSEDYSSPNCKLGRMVEKGEILRLKRGVYETDPTTPPYLVAGHIYGPSYVSFEYALFRHQMIPEMSYTVTCATCGKHKTKRFSNQLGRFVYQDVPEAVFPLGVETLEQDGREYRFATLEKAVCDKLYKMPPIRNYNDLETLMFDDLRFDEERVLELDRDRISIFAELYGSSTIRTLDRYLGAKV